MGSPWITTASLRHFVEPSWRTYVLVMLSASAAIIGMVFKTWHKTQMDLSVYYVGAHHLFDGRLYDVYGAGTAHLPFTYPPFAALFFWPISVFTIGTAQAIWLVISGAALLGLVAVSIWAVRPDLDKRSLWMLALLVIGPVFWFEPIEANFTFGQINILLVLMVMVDLLVLARRGRGLPAGILTGVAAAIKLIPLVFVLYLAVTRQFRALCWSVAAFLCATGLALACDPRVTWQFITKYSFDESRIGSVFYISNQSFRGSIDRLTHSTVSTAVAALASALIVAGGLYVAYLAFRQSSVVLALIVVGVTGLLASPITWTHHIVWVVPILAWILLAHDRPRRAQWWASLTLLLAWTAPIWLVSTAPAQELRENLLQAVAGNAYFFAMIGFFVGASVTTMSRSRRKQIPDIGEEQTVQGEFGGSSEISGVTSQRTTIEASTRQFGLPA